MQMKAKIYSGFIQLALCFSVAAAEAQPEKVPGVSSADLLTVVLGLAIVMGLIFGCAWLIKRMGAMPAAGGGAIKVLAVLPLGARERVTLVEVGGKQLLLGVTATQITTLHTFDEPVLDAAQTTNNSEFAQKLHQLMSRK